MNFKRQAIKTSFWGLLLGFSPLTHATLTAVFPPSVRPRAAVWLDQSRIFTAENSSQRSRPVWIHGGDSLASAWSNGSSLRLKIARGDKGPLPEPRTLPDVIESFPNPATTWYAGSRFGFGLLGALERHFQTPWVIVSTAIAGSLLVPDQSRVDSPSGNPFQHMMDTQNPDRVRLITFSLGNNDICDGHNPLAEHTQRVREDLARLRRTFPQATILPFQVIPVHAISRSIFAELEALPPSPGKTRVIEYCRKMWEEVCQIGRAHV